VAREIRESVAAAPRNELPRYDWVIAHAWSFFRPATGVDEQAENLSQVDAPNHGGVRGYTPVTWCARRLPRDVRVVGPEELIWRIRMKYSPEQTGESIRRFEP
jgi:hypothetical protein